MRRLSLLAALPLFLSAAISLRSQTLLTLPQPSPAASVSQTIGITEVSVSYHRPSVNQREIWGKLVPYGYGYLENFGTSHEAPWRAGANENTVISFQHDVTVAGQSLKAGKYGLSMALTSEGTVTVIFSHDTALWGSFFYDRSHDALRVDVTWEDAPFHEQLSYDFTTVTRDSAVLALSWEKKRIPIPIKTDTNANVVASMKSELHNARGFNFEARLEAASYLVANNLDLALALEVSEEAINDPYSGVKNARTLAMKALVLDRLGRTEESKAVGDDMVKIATPAEVHQYARQLLAQGKSSRALEMFKANAALHPDVWPVNYGLARGYSAVGDYPAALAALLKAEKQIPEGDTADQQAIKRNVERLKRGEDINK